MTEYNTLKEDKDWSKPKEVTNLDIGFGPKNLSDYLPAYKSIPEDFRNECGEGKKWTHIVDQWFFSGIRLIEIVTKEGVDKEMAMRHLSMIMHSFEPQHEHKTAGAAYLMSLWFEKFEFEEVKK